MKLGIWELLGKNEGEKGEDPVGQSKVRENGRVEKGHVVSAFRDKRA